MKKNVYVEKRLSKNNTEYVRMFIDYGYTELVISFNVAQIAQYLDMKPSQINALKLNEKVLVGIFEIKGA